MAEDLPAGPVGGGDVSLTPTEDDLLWDWMGSLFKQVDEQLPPDARAGLVKACSTAHYRFLNMGAALDRFRGDLPGFLRFLSETWGWKIEQEAGGRVIRADENKDFCVCPMIRRGILTRTPTLCSCSEGFAERMFAEVTGGPASARVIRSILRGDPSCVYQVTLAPAPAGIQE